MSRTTIQHAKSMKETIDDEKGNYADYKQRQEAAGKAYLSYVRWFHHFWFTGKRL